uniref:Disease resistance protein At4g27190-like leucine-rich repeats domain-containing protein n=1 Tax=Arundo donax TaxID=35708 RepID=A0A0A9CNQ2_ARUDO
MRTEVIRADTIEAAAAKILNELKEDTNAARSISSRNNVVYFDGWDGLGASAVLRAIAQDEAAKMEFEQIIHIDSSMWENRRALQRAVAEQLDLPAQVIEMFDRQDEEDDFHGVAQGSRKELQQVVREMYGHIQKLNRRFLVIFHNGSSEEIDMASCCGFPLSGYSTNKVLWTFQGRFRLKPWMKVDMAMKSAGTTDVFLSAGEQDPQGVWSYRVRQEAAEVVAAWKNNTGPRGIIDQPAQVTECFLYMLELCCRGCHSIYYDWATHGANYWICDGIIQQGERCIGADDDHDGLWRTADALQHEMQLDVDYHQYLPSSHLARFVESKPYWASPTYGFTRIPARATHNGDMFQHYFDKLSVLKLSHCGFTFQSPPFLCCHNLRFLWIDHCEVVGVSPDGAEEEEDIRQCFERLWVLDVRYTCCDQILSARMMDLMTQLRELNVMGAQEWDIGQLQGRLHNIRKLRVKYSTIRCSCSEADLFSEMSKMELLDFSGNRTISTMTRLYGPGVTSSSSCLETVIVDGYNGLRQISFEGCTKLKNLFLRQWAQVLSTLDISGTAVKTLDLTTMLYLNELCLLDCEKLCAILWPPDDNMIKENLLNLRIDTTKSASSTARFREEEAKEGSTAATGTSAAAALHGSRPTSDYRWYISIRDARLLVSLEPVYNDSRKAHVEISSPTRPTVPADGGKYEGIKSGSSSDQQQVLVNVQQQAAPTIYADTTVDHMQQMWMWPCPDAPYLPLDSCYMHIQDQMRAKLPRGGEETTTITVPKFVIDSAKILHVHDSLSITVLPSDTAWGSEWHELEWCRIERCPKLDSVFTPGNEQSVFEYELRTFWASQLPKARYIWKWSEHARRKFFHLTLLHLDCCPRLIHVLPLSRDMFIDGLPLLETLEIIWCGDIREVFPLDTYDNRHLEQLPQPTAFTIVLPKLKRIHLHELPKLQRICGLGLRMLASELETVKVRGCWSLKSLLVIGVSNKVVECDCEKEWWDRLEWEDDSQVHHYKPIHSPYYKKTLLRGSVLR